MNRSSTRGIFLSIVVLFSITIIAFPSMAYGEEITVNSIALEETSVLELTNDSNENVNTVRMWLGSDFSFMSFKTEKGWVGEKNAQGVIIFTTSEPIKPGESVKFGVKTDKPNPGINWQALDSKNAEMSIGKSIPKALPNVTENPELDQNLNNIDESISTESIFRIIPEKPNVGSTIRVTGENFGSSQELDFYIDTKKIGTFVTDQNGHFITTMKIPDDQKADRVDLLIKDKEGKEKKISLRIEEEKSRTTPTQDIPLTVQGIPSVIHRGDFLEIFGTGQPNSGVTIEITGPDGEVVRTRTAQSSNKGDWALEPLLVPLDRPFGKYTGIVSDGRNSRTESWTVESDKTIIIIPTSLKFEPGETMRFNGTALPNKPIELILESPFGKEVKSDIIQVEDSGIVEFEFPTTQNTIEGTYTLIATQEKKKEFTYAGLGMLPVTPVNLEFDKLNYKATDTATITLSGKASEVISLLIVDPGDKPKGDAVSIKLQPDGRGKHSLDLKGYSSGVYTAVVSKGSAQSSEIFTVGLATGSGKIDINTTKLNYKAGDSILVLGETGPNVLLTLTMLNPDGDEIKVKETFSDKSGKITEDEFRIPSNAESGTWVINAKSGSNFDNAKVEVVTSILEGMAVVAEKGQNIPGSGDTIMIKVFGATANVKIEIIAEDGEVIDSLFGIITKTGEIAQLWIISPDTEPGSYTIKVTNPTDSAETTFEIQ
ncbi:biofilm-associated protein [Nitrosopumilus sp.]|uniref:biofilm-associated protein n=1 Tax=Nitrosopumilus sp. TaxID=2024843 RepID=UPI0034A09B6D